MDLSQLALASCHRADQSPCLPSLPRCFRSSLFLSFSLPPTHTHSASPSESPDETSAQLREARRRTDAICPSLSSSRRFRHVSDATLLKGRISPDLSCPFPFIVVLLSHPHHIAKSRSTAWTILEPKTRRPSPLPATLVCRRVQRVSPALLQCLRCPASLRCRHCLPRTP